MRRLPVVVLLVLAAGCSEPATPQDTDDASPIGTPGLPPGVGEARATDNLPALSFAAGEHDETVTFDGTFASPDPCFLPGPGQDGCTGLEFDLTPQVPADAPVSITPAITSNNCVDARVRITEGDSVTEFYIGNTDTAFTQRIVRTEAGTVTLVLHNCNFLSTETGATVPVQAQVRTTVRPDVMAPGLPVTVQLAAGDRLLAMGDGLEEFVVYPPRMDPVTVGDPFQFNVTPDLPAGQYLLFARGGTEFMVHGSAATPLVALPLQYAYGEPRPVPSGQDLTWDVDVPGVPLAIGILLASEGSPTGGYIESYTLTASQDGEAVFTLEESGCTPMCLITPPTAYSTRGYGSGFLPEGIGRGPLTFLLSTSQSMGYTVEETVVWVRLDA